MAIEEQEREKILEILKNGVLSITFEKKDTTLREMFCTLKKDLIKPVEKKTNRTKKKNSDVQPVWSLDSDGWRCFRWDSIHEYREINWRNVL